LFRALLLLGLTAAEVGPQSFGKPLAGARFARSRRDGSNFMRAGGRAGAARRFHNLLTKIFRIFRFAKSASIHNCFSGKAQDVVECRSSQGKAPTVCPEFC
jgi:hypothetical protein